MNIQRGQTVHLIAVFPPSFAGLATVGYALKNPDGTTTPAPAAARTTTGVVDHGNGLYGVEWTAPSSASWHGYVEWDTGGGSPIYAHDDLEVLAGPLASDDSRIANLDAAVSSRVPASDARLANLDATISSRADQATVAEAAGLSGSNVGLRDVNYAGDNLLSYNLFVYDSHGNAATNDGLTGVLHVYRVTNTFDVNGKILTSVTEKLA